MNARTNEAVPARPEGCDERPLVYATVRPIHSISPDAPPIDTNITPQTEAQSRTGRNN